MLKKIKSSKFTILSFIFLALFLITRVSFGNTILATDHLATELHLSCQHDLGLGITCAPIPLISLIIPIFVYIGVKFIRSSQEPQIAEQLANNKSPPLL